MEGVELSDDIIFESFSKVDSGVITCPLLISMWSSRLEGPTVEHVHSSSASSGRQICIASCARNSLSKEQPPPPPPFPPMAGGNGRITFSMFPTILTNELDDSPLPSPPPTITVYSSRDTSSQKTQCQEKRALLSSDRECLD